MQAFFFGGADRQLLACWDEAAGAAAVRDAPAVLLIGPHGQEAIRAHRLLRVLASRLSREGHDVLRFDPYGSGDSAGDDDALDLDSWRQDVVLAATELRRRTRGRPQVWIGFRLGATMAAEAARERSTAPVALALVEPVADGAAYLDEMAVATVRLLEASMSIKEPGWRLGLQREPERWQREAVGFALGERLHDHLRNWTVDRLTAGADLPMTVVVPSEAQREQVLAWPWPAGHEGRRGGPAAVLTASYEFNWTAEEALNAALVPNPLLATLVGWAARFGGER